MKRTVTEILIEVEETVCVRSGTKQSVADAANPNAAVIETIVCPSCGGAFLPTGNLENQNEKE